MDDEKILADAFQAHRGHLRGVAYRMLGSHGEAEDAVQEAWLRLGRAGGGEIANLRGWLTTVVGRICLDMLRARRARREEPMDDERGRIELVAANDDAARDLETADSVGMALLVVLETLPPAERIAFVLHDMFDVPFDEIARIVERSPEAARQLASRARRRVRGHEANTAPDRARREEIVRAFLAASRDGDFEGLMAVLDPDVVFRGDEAAARLGAARELQGAPAVAGAFKGRARGAVPALADGRLALAVSINDRLHIVLRFDFDGERIARIEAVADPDRLAEIELELL